ncbi:hypothetical protein FOL47_008099, partial [Perkinsus chesapeaki]
MDKIKHIDTRSMFIFLALSSSRYIEDLAPDMNQGTAASILMAAYAVGTFIASLVTGPLSDRLGRRPVFLAAMTIYTVAQFLMAVAWDIASFAGFRAMAGVAAGTRPCIMAYLTDSSRPIDMKMYGVFMGLFVVVGQSLGPAVGGALASVTLSFPFYFIGVISAILLVLMYLFLRESLEKDKNGVPINKFANPDAKDPPKNKYLWPTVMCLATASFCGQYLQINWSTVSGLIGADQYHLSTSANGGALGIQAIASILDGSAKRNLLAFDSTNWKNLTCFWNSTASGTLQCSSAESAPLV